ncbi:hypothetical protein [Absidia glauca]|uniref:Ndc10 domain-containing protein n=1 Tax=Absidia glauca TaxID=4829 RepID=A0A163MH62_ABSGL|nr:hypothetical protein [Absidia glauca]
MPSISIKRYQEQSIPVLCASVITTMNGAYLTSLPGEMMRSMASFPTNGRSFYLARAALDPPTSLCKKLFPAVREWHDRLAAKELSHDNTSLFNLPSLPMHLFCTGDHDARKDVYTSLDAHDGTPPLPSHLTSFNFL